MLTRIAIPPGKEQILLLLSDNNLMCACVKQSETMLKIVMIKCSCICVREGNNKGHIYIYVGHVFFDEIMK